MTILRLAILWHMHQPFYLEPNEGRFAMPWVRLHSFKDYLDMPLLAGAQAGVSVNFNLVPSLMEQWEAWRRGCQDRVQELCELPVARLEPEERVELVGLLFRAHPQTMIAPLPEYAELHQRWQARGSESIRDPELVRLKYWFHLAWLDPLFREEPVPAGFLQDNQRLTEANWHEFRNYLDSFPDRLFDTYGRLHREGRIEVSVTPYFHPILPLLIDTDCAREARPEVDLPAERFRAPDDARWQLREARAAVHRWLDITPDGLWPAEGSVSEAALRIAAEEGFAWAATDEQVLANSLGLSNLNLPGPERAALLYRPLRRRFGDNALRLVFRDHFLSDRIGFAYASWDPEKAVDDFLGHLERIRREATQPEPLVTVILDGENCWEFYHQDGLPFLRLLYRRLAETEWLRLDTISRHLAETEAEDLERVRAGSWIDGSFSIWIGHPADNRSWDYLARARRDLLEHGGGAHPLAKGEGDLAPSLQSAWRSLFAAEGSDWNWWYGDDHNSLDDDTFDSLYRSHLQSVYRDLELEVPACLHEPIAVMGAAAAAGGMVPTGFSEVRVDGKVSHFYEWRNAACHVVAGTGGAMTRADRLVEAVWLAFGPGDCFLRVDLNTASPDAAALRRLSVNFKGPQPRRFRIALHEPGAPLQAETEGPGGWDAVASGGRWAWKDILELAIPWPELPGRAGQEVSFDLTFLGETGILDVMPAGAPLVFALPDADYDRIMWKI
ncbi:MAG: hypothetical protein JW819_05290 [Candidatus Krumholzibacteriota bacterium]|nr:hypothetical protein [Candidatus Krumholzibacteriota bacterium]